MKMSVLLTMPFLFALILSVRANGAMAEKVLYEQNFNSGGPGLPADWWYEGSKAVRIENGWLRTDAKKDGTGEDYINSTVWLNRVFEGDLRVEFDAKVISGSNNINFFFLYSDPDGTPLIETRESRTNADYGKYHDLNGYIITYLGNIPARFRLRDCPGFNLLEEVNDFEVVKGKTYHVALSKVGNRITYAVDGTVYVDFTDTVKNPEHKKGIMGFRTWSTDLLWDNFKVVQLNDPVEPALKIDSVTQLKPHRKALEIR